ncbi:Box C/D snoRNA protein 1 [Acrasis kona]|uniref:Box C/D snoRNA protein 1 n=1 Tax=Acrasis kona TaxID=1008807 RepID=A0AAW2YYI8_9EUKA
MTDEIPHNTEEKVDINVNTNINEEQNEEKINTEKEPPLKKNRLGPCQVCSTNESKYTCPGCSIHFCNLSCSKKHKEDTKCTGKRDVTKFVELSKFDLNTLRSDAKLKSDRSERSRKADNIDDHTFQFHPAHVKFVQRRIHERSIHMQLMPQGMTRRERNTTQYKNKEDKVFWRIELIFDQQLDENNNKVEVYEKHVDENVSLNTFLLQYIDASSVSVTGDSVGTSTLITHATTRDKLKNYTDRLAENNTSTCPFSFFMLVERKPPSSKPNEVLYYELDGSKSLRNSLVDKIVVEFPIIHVVLPSEKQSYQVITQEQIQETLQELKDRINERKEKKKQFQERKEQHEQKIAERQEKYQQSKNDNQRGSDTHRGRGRGNFVQRGRGRGGGQYNNSRGGHK